MRNDKKEEIPTLNIERSPSFIVLAVSLTAVLDYFTYWLFTNINPWGFIVMIPASILSFQTLWWLLTPFAHVFENRIEIKQSLLHEKIRYFVDIQNAKLSKNKLLITYNDDEEEALSLFGIKPAHLTTFQLVFDKSVAESLKTRI